MFEDLYTTFLHARNTAERLLRAHSAEVDSFAREYHASEAIRHLTDLSNAMGFDLVKREDKQSEAA